MPDDLLARVREQATRAKPSVRAAAMLRISRVETAFDRGQARITFEMALEDTRRLSGRERDSLLEQARLVAAAVAPHLLEAIAPNNRGPHQQFTSDMLVRIMLDHGHVDAAFDYMTRHVAPSVFPFGFVSSLMHRLEDQELRLAALRRTIEAWRAARDGMLFEPSMFIRLYGSQWRVLPEEEAREVVREIVRVTLEQPEQPMTATYGEGKIEITSGRQNTLFQVLHVLRHLEGPLAESLIASHAQLAAAVQRYPNGLETMRQEDEERRKKAAGQSGGSGFLMCGDPQERDYMMALMQASKDGDFTPPFEHALQRYREDTAPDSPNEALKVFWPSASRFRNILYSAGKRLGREADVYLDRIPDDDLRLFALIELIAALAGLPELPGTEQYRPRRGGPPGRSFRGQRPGGAGGTAIGEEPFSGPDGSLVRCPKCSASPDAEERWGCTCGHIWNTFHTRGLCPACHYQWEVTVCHQCGEVSPHEDWYMPK